MWLIKDYLNCRKLVGSRGSYQHPDNPTKEELAKLSAFVRTHYPEPKDKDKILHDLMTSGQYNLIDEYKVEVNIKEGLHKTIIPCINVRDARIMDSILEKHPNLLRSGLWGMGILKYMPEPATEAETDIKSPIIITKFEPFQASNINFSDFCAKRKEFSLAEWIDVLINTIGLNPEVYTQRTKLILLSRLITLVEGNTNLMELGPKATGKTYLYRNISFYTRIISGGRVSPAVLFYNIAARTFGELAAKDCVVFDEISRISFSNPDEMMGKMKDYMVDGHFERGLKKAHSTCSLNFTGNVEVEGEVPIEEFANVLPEFLRKDSAFVDRIHGFIPGWELPKIMQSEIHLSKNYGFVNDYFCEILHELRKQDFQIHITKDVELSSDEKVTIRDEKAIKKTAAGLLKVLCPNDEFGDDELKLCMDIAIEYRQRVADWLHKLSPGEFKRKHFRYKIIG